MYLISRGIRFTAIINLILLLNVESLLANDHDVSQFQTRDSETWYIVARHDSAFDQASNQSIYQSLLGHKVCTYGFTNAGTISWRSHYEPYNMPDEIAVVSRDQAYEYLMTGKCDVGIFPNNFIQSVDYRKTLKVLTSISYNLGDS